MAEKIHIKGLLKTGMMALKLAEISGVLNLQQFDKTRCISEEITEELAEKGFG